MTQEHGLGNAVLLLSCPDQRGIVAAVATFVSEHGGNIVHADQHTDAELGVFFQRVEFELGGLSLARDQIASRFQPIADRFGMHFDLRFSADRARLAILSSRLTHCLYDLLARWRSGELNCDLAMVVSNHPDHREIAERFDVEFHHVPVTPATRHAANAQMLELLEHRSVDLVVLARYMQILEAAFVDRLRMRVINIHHSFLPAFPGAQPYRQAYERGVKLIGATAHYATEERHPPRRRRGSCAQGT
jgi:formyltetrahydrofolate deformylase